MLQKYITQVSQFISKLTDRDKKLLIAAVILIIAAMFDRLFIAPTMSRLSSLDEEIVKEEDVIKRDLHFLGYKNKILKESKAVGSYFTEKVATDDEIIAAFLKKIEIVATKANVVLAKVTPSTGQQDKDNLKYSADVECSGRFTEVIMFMHLINSSDELTKVVKYNLVSKKADSDEIKATMTISKMIVSKHNLVKPANPAATTVQADVATPTKK